MEKPPEKEAAIFELKNQTREGLKARIESKYEGNEEEIEAFINSLSEDDLQKWMLIEALADKYEFDAYPDIVEGIHEMSIEQVRQMIEETSQQQQEEKLAQMIEKQHAAKAERIAKAEKARDERYRIKMIQALIKQVGEKYVDSYKTMTIAELEEVMNGFGIKVEKDEELDPYHTIDETLYTGTNGQ